MNQPITMPALSDTMSNGRLVRWTKHIGDPIKKGESIAEVETDKAIMDVEAFHDGYLGGPLTAEDTQVPVGQVIGYIADSPTQSTQVSSAAAPSPPASVTSPPPAEPVSANSGTAASAVIQPSAPESSSAPERSSGARMSPYARRLAQQRAAHASPEQAAPPETHADVMRSALRQPPPASDLDAGPPYRIAWPSSVREAVANNMIKSLATPTFHVAAQLSVGALKKAATEGGISLTLLLARAAALAVKVNPLFNAAYTPGGLALRQRVDVAIAVDTPDGLIAAVLRDVAERTLAQLSTDWRGLRDRVSTRRLAPEDYQGATFYLSNLGTFPVVRSFDAVLPVGATAILCVAAAEDERVIFTLGCDHRVVAGADAARFLQSFAQLLAEPGPWGRPASASP